MLPLCGGRDSRHILFEQLRQGRPPGHCLTTAHFPPRGDEDVRVAQALTREPGLVHITLAQPGSWFMAEQRKNLLTNFCSDEHAWYMVVADYLLARMPSPLLRHRFLLPRLCAGLFSPARSAATHWYAPLALYLHQLGATPD